MEKNKSSDTVGANMELNSRLDSGKGIPTTNGETEAVSANLKMDEQFRENSRDQHSEDLSPAFVYNPAIRMNPDDRK